jgi:hypothetical protein
MCTTCEVISPTAISNLSTALNIIQGLSITNSCFKFRFPDQHFVFTVCYKSNHLILLEENNWWQYLWISLYLCHLLHFSFHFISLESKYSSQNFGSKAVSITAQYYQCLYNSSISMAFLSWKCANIFQRFAPLQCWYFLIQEILHTQFLTY